MKAPPFQIRELEKVIDKKSLSRAIGMVNAIPAVRLSLDGNSVTFIEKETMDQLQRSNRHRAEIIEVYPDGKAAVKFTSGRIECVMPRGVQLVVGQRGMVDYVRSLNGYEWVFDPFKV